MDKNEILEIAKKLGDAIGGSDEISRLNASKAAQEADEEAQKLIGEYNLKRLSVMQRAAKEENTPEKTEEYKKELAEEFDRLMKNAVIKEYIDANDAVENLVSQAKSIIDYYAYGKTECTSDCSTCGGKCHR